MLDMTVGDAATHGMGQHRTGTAQLSPQLGGHTRDQRRGQCGSGSSMFWPSAALPTFASDFCLRAA